MPVGLYAESAERVVLKDYGDAPPIEKRFRVRVSLASLKHGTSSHAFDPRSPFAHRAFAPTACDVALEVRRWLGAGADKPIEAMRNPAAAIKFGVRVS